MPLILPLGCPGRMLAEQLNSLYSWITRAGCIFTNEAEAKVMFPQGPSPCNVTEEELNYIDASFVFLYVVF